MNNNTEIILETIGRNKTGLNISSLERKTPLSRGQLRTSLSFLLGARLVFIKEKGKSKIFFLSEDKAQWINNR